jgi:hypothetical protein
VICSRKGDFVWIVVGIDQIFVVAYQILEESLKFSIFFDFVELLTFLQKNTKIIYQIDGVLMA